MPDSNSTTEWMDDIHPFLPDWRQYDAFPGYPAVEWFDDQPYPPFEEFRDTSKMMLDPSVTFNMIKLIGNAGDDELNIGQLVIHQGRFGEVIHKYTFMQGAKTKYLIEFDPLYTVVRR